MNSPNQQQHPWLTAAAKTCAAAGDLLIPHSCPGCGAPGDLCPQCRDELRQKPARIATTIPVPVPIWSCGPYSGARRELVIAAKEHHNIRARQAMGATLAGTLNHLVGEGIIDHPRSTPIVLVPAPTRPSASRRRGGDPVTAACSFASETLTNTTVAPLLETAEKALDSSGLSARSRRTNISGQIRPMRPDLGRNQGQSLETSTIVLFDDVVTTGSTTAESTLVLASMGIRVHLAIAFTRA